MATATSVRDESLPGWAYPALFAAAVLVYWAPRLFRGFWVDEAGTYWMVHEGWSKVSHHLGIIPSESIIYTYMAAFFASAGSYKEVLLRLPSIAGMLLAGLIVYKLAERIAGAGSGWIAAVPFVCAGAIVESATNARPYALGVAVVLASFWNLREWVQTSSNRSFAGYCICSACIVYFHYLFGLVFAAQAIYLIAAIRMGREISLRRVAIAAAGIGAAALPLVWQFLHALRLYQDWSRPVLPTLATLASFYPLQVLIPAAAGLILYRWLYPQWWRSAALLARDDAVLLSAWMLLPPVFVFVLARTSSYMLFATRYMIYALPPFFILLAWSIEKVRKQRARFALVLGIALCAALYVPQLKMNEWRTPLRLVRDFAESDTPVMVRSGVVQSSVLDWKSGPRPDSYLFAPLAAYPIPNEIIPVPFFVDKNAGEYLQQQISQRATMHRRFCLVAEKDTDALSLISAWFKEHGYTASTHEAGGFEVVLYQAGL